MKELLKTSFVLANKNIVLACMLVIFSIVTSVYVAVSQSLSGGAASQALVLYVLALIAFFAGFFNQVKAIVNNDEGKMKFLEGVGEYFLPMSGICVISLISYLVVGLLASLITVNIYGGVEPVMSAMNKVLSVVQNSAADTSSIDVQTVQIVLTMVLILWAFWGLLSFVLLYWVPVLYFDNVRNIFVSFWQGLKFLFKTFWKSLLIFILAVLAICIIGFLSAISSSLALLEVLLSMFNYYIILVFVFAVFLLYKKQIQEKVEE